MEKTRNSELYLGNGVGYCVSNRINSKMRKQIPCAIYSKSSKVSIKNDDSEKTNYQQRKPTKEAYYGKNWRVRLRMKKKRLNHLRREGLGKVPRS